MEIVTAFNTNTLNVQIQILGTCEEPLFRASDIGLVLNVVQIRNSIKDFNTTEKVVRTVQTPGGPQEITFLTEKGLYNVLFRSNKPIAKIFKNWVCDVIKEIRLTGKYELEKKLVEKEQQLVEKDQQLNDNIINNFKNTESVYMGWADENDLKIGFSKNPEERLACHRREIRRDFKIEYIFKSIYYIRLETLIKTDEFLSKYRVERTYNGKKQTEIFRLDNNFDIKAFYNYVLKLQHNLEKEDILTKENSELKTELAEANTLIAELRLKISQLENDDMEKKRIELKETELEINKKILKLDYDKEKIPKSNEGRYQIYDPNTLKLIKTYESIREVINETKLFKDVNSFTLGRHIENNQAYKGYRFIRLKRTYKIQEYSIPPTVIVDRSPTYEQVVQVNKENTKILKIFSNADEASKSLFTDEEEIRKAKKAITNNLSEDENAIAKGYRWFRISDVNKKMLDEYLKDKKLPEVVINKGQKKVYKYNKDRQLIIEYKSMKEALQTEHVSDAKLRKSIISDELLNGYYFSFELT